MASPLEGRNPFLESCYRGEALPVRPEEWMLVDLIRTIMKKTAAANLPALHDGCDGLRCRAARTPRFASRVV